MTARLERILDAILMATATAVGVFSVLVGLSVLYVTHAQTGTVTQVKLSTVTATASDKSSTCTFTNPNPPAIAISCSVGTAVYLTASVIPNGAITPGASGSFTPPGHSFTWTLNTNSANQQSFAITADGGSLSGTF